MANIVGVFNIGQDAELRYMPNGEPVLNMSLAYNYGQKDSEGKRPSQWIDAALFGKRAESLKEHMTKGTKIYAVLDDPRLETYQKKDQTTGTKMVARVASLEFAGGPRQQTGQGESKGPKQPQSNGSYEDSEIPF
jgi:single-strand DNA-binding protein